MTISELYEPMLSRDIEPIRVCARRFGQEHGSEGLFRAVSRFALLGASPSQHGKHALISSVAAREIEDELEGRYDELLIECAIYAAQSRLPWSEPPITDPPSVEEDHPDSLQEIRAAIAAHDRLRGEAWLAARLRRPDLARDFFTIAAEDLADFGHKLIVAVSVWKLAQLHQQPKAFAFLRVAVVEWTSYSENLRPSGQEEPGDRGSTVRALVQNVIEQKGALEAFHRLALYDAAMEAARLSGEESIERRVASFLWSGRAARRVRAARGGSAMAPEPPIYPLARDYAEYLKSFAISKRMAPWADPNTIRAAAKYNRDHAPSFEEWSFA